MNSFLLKCRGLHYLSFLAHCLSTGRLVRRDLNSTSVYARLLHCIWLWQWDQWDVFSCRLVLV